MMVPQPSNGGRGSLDTAVLMIYLASLHSFLVGRLVVPFNPASAYHEYVTWKEF